MSGKLTIGLPSKGRLQENANAFFARAGLRVKQDGGRGYTGRLAGIENVEIAFLSASEIAGQLEQGLIQLGVTGEDLIREKLSTPERDVELLLPLGFGHADVVVAVPQSWIDVATMADLDDVALDKVSQFEKDLLNYFQTSGKPIWDEINDKHALDSDLEKKLADAIRAFKSSWKA